MQWWHKLIQKSLKCIFWKLIPFGLSFYWYKALLYVNMFQHVSEEALITHYLATASVIGPFVTIIGLIFSSLDSDWLNVNRFETFSLVMWIFQESRDTRSEKMIQLKILYIFFFRMYFNEIWKKEEWEKLWNVCHH